MQNKSIKRGIRVLLRRITEHVKAQNWFAVGLDFFIVVAGILLAFWVNAWADGRAQTRSLHAALGSLQAEIQFNIAQIDKYSNIHADIVAAGQGLLEYANDPDLDTVPLGFVGKVFVAGYTTDYSTGALTAIINQNDLTVMQSDELRLLISALPSEFEDTIEDELTLIQLVDTVWIVYISQKLPVGPLWTKAYEDIWASTFKPPEGGPHSNGISAPEFAELAATLIFQNHIENRIAYERQAIREQNELRQTLQEALVLIETEIK